MSDFPFQEKILKQNESIREFNENIDSKELVWHRDKEDRIIEVIKNDNWLIQMDNELPKILKDKIFIPKESYHRVIKGNGNLIVKITKLDT